MNDIIIRPKKIWSLTDIKEVWQYRDLFYIFAWRDIKVRYKQTTLGVLWVIFQPLITMLIFTVFFGNLAKIPSGKLPYPLFVLIGLIFWNYFSAVLTHASSSMIENENIIKKVYFPKIILPLSSLVTSLVDLGINLVMLSVFGLILGFIPSVLILIAIPFGIVITAMTAGGLGLFLASVNVKYRDVRYILPFFIQILLFLTPVIYSVDNLSVRNKYIMAANPISSVIESIRRIYAGGELIHPSILFISFISAAVILIGGWWYFRKTEQFFADIV